MAFKVIKGNRVGVGVEGQGALDPDVHDHETLGTELVRQDLNGVADEQARPGEGVKDAENPDEEDHGVVCARGLLLVVETRGQGPEDEGAEHTRRRGKEHGAAADLVDKHGHGDGNDEGETHLAGRETELRSRIIDTGGFVKHAGVVGDDGIARPLREDAERDEDDEAVPVTLGLEEVEVAAGLGGLVLEADRLLDLAELELDGGVVHVAVGVVLGEDVQRLVVLILGHQVAGRLRHPEDEGELDDGGDRLEQGRNAPRPVAVQEVGAEGNPSHDYASR